MLGERVFDARVADLFSGTGALGLEALSRGAASLDAYEARADARRIIADNATSIGEVARVRVHSGRLPGCLGAGEPWDLVLMDPPWDSDLATKTAESLVTKRRIGLDAVLVVEERKGKEAADERWLAMGLRALDRRRYGDTSLVLLVPDPADHQQ